MAHHVPVDELAVHLIVRYGVRPWPNDAHAPLQNVDELRQLVKRRTAQEAAERGDAAIVARRLADLLAILLHGHRAKLVDRDLSPIQAVAALPEQHRARR